MEVIEDICSAENTISKLIKRHGSVREHNFWFYQNQNTAYSKVYLFRHKDSGIFSIKYKSGIWEVIGDVLSTPGKREELFRVFLDHTLKKKKEKKIFAFVPEKLYRVVETILQKDGGYKFTQAPRIYYTPVFNLKKWPGTLEGRQWKKVRNARNSLQKKHKVEIIPSTEINKRKLRKIVMDWRKRRPKIEKTYYTKMYLNFIENGFKGTDIARTIMVDNEPCSITAGWKIPNTLDYYSALGIYNYRHNGLGEVANVDDLSQIKAKGYRRADFGDSTQSLLSFKKKFRPDSFYRTYWFHLVKR
jgi:hypothetical protein